MFSKSDNKLIQELVAKLNIPIPIAQLLVIRGIKSAADSEVFLKATYYPLESSIPDLKKSAHLLIESLEKKHQILIYADCTVSGFLNGIILFSFLRPLSNSVRIIMPNRKSQGYGIQHDVVKIAYTEQTKLIFFMSCHFGSLDDYRRIKSDYNSQYIFIHENRREQFEINELQLNSDSDNSNTLKLFRLLELIEYEMKINELERVIDLFALALHADGTNMFGIARYIVKGVRSFSNLKANTILKELEKRILQPDSISWYKIPSIINSNLILGENDLLISSFINKNITKSENNSEKLVRNHQMRLNTSFKKYQEFENFNTEIVDEKVLLYQIEEAEPDQMNFIAMKYSGKYNRPCFVFRKFKNLNIGSAYSDSSINLKECLKTLNIESVKGHKNSLSCTVTDLELKRIKDELPGLISLNRSLTYDVLLEIDQVDDRFIRLLNLFEPHGEGNQKPVFLAKNIEIVGSIRILKQKHLKFQVKQGKNIVDAIAFNLSDDYDWVLSKRSKISFRFQLIETFWAGKKSLQLSIIGFDSN